MPGRWATSSTDRSRSTSSSTPGCRPAGSPSPPRRSPAFAERGGPAGDTTISRAKMVLEVNGTRHPLQPPGLVIGRGSDADLRINDPGISRMHAQIRVNSSGQGLQIDIVDLGSTNGIVVNGQKVRQAVLYEGSRIEIGSTRMLVHAPAGR